MQGLNTVIPQNWALDAAKGAISGTGIITKFGFNDVVSTGTTPEDIWNYGGVFVPPTTARVHYITSSSSNDTSSGTGARTVLIYGINGSYARITETVTMNGTSNVSTANSYLHIHLMQETSVGSNGSNVGTITATAQTDATVTCSMDAGQGQSSSTIYLVPDGYKGYIMKIRARMSNTTSNSTAVVALYTQPFGAGYQLKTRLGMNNNGNSFVETDYSNSTPFIIQAKSWVKLRCVSVTNNNTAVEGEYDLILVQD
jgi:hypothetical protein